MEKKKIIFISIIAITTLITLVLGFYIFSNYQDYRYKTATYCYEWDLKGEHIHGDYNLSCVCSGELIYDSCTRSKYCLPEGGTVKCLGKIKIKKK